MARQYQGQVISSPNTTSANSAAIDCTNLIAISVQAVSSGTPTAVVKLQASNDSPIGSPGVNGGQPYAPTNWNDIASATVSVGTPGSFLIPKQDLCYQFVRVVFTSSDAMATGSTQVNIKVLGY